MGSRNTGKADVIILSLLLFSLHYIEGLYSHCKKRGFIITHDNDQQSNFRRLATMSSATIIGFRPADEILVS
jgi:tRNA G37 N-methylase Trm5